MALLINDDCIACDACREECPTEAIEEGDPIYYIDSDRCTECVEIYDEPACISVCPIDCIVLDKDSVESITELQFKYRNILKEEE